jgi:hypothetical protein
MHVILGAAAGYLAGVFTPGVARKIKSWFSKEASTAVTTVTTDVAKKL